MIETLSDGDFIAWCYQELLGRPGDPEGSRFFLGELRRGASRLTVVESFVSARPRPTGAQETIADSGQDDQTFVDWAFQSLLGRAPEAEAQAHYLAQLAGGLTRMALVEALIGSPEYRDKMSRYSSYRFVPPGHFYSPIPSDEDIAAHRHFNWAPEQLPGIALRHAQQLELLERLRPFYAEIPFTAERQPGLRYAYANPSYSYADAILLYCMIRLARPRRIIEIGSGNSSCVILDTNDRHFDGAISCRFIEPYPDYLRSLLKPTDHSVELIEHRLQEVPLAPFTELEAGDLLIVDSTHVSRLHSDVNRIFFEILPSLRPGVLIHIHDVLYPFEYPVSWLERGWAWNEQYLLRAFLQYNAAFQIELFSTYMLARERPWFEQHMPDCLKDTGGCIWLRRNDLPGPQE